MQWLLRGVMAIAGFGLCMLISFTLVRQWTQDLPPSTGVAPAAAQAAPALRNAANELAMLGNDLFARIAPGKPASAEDAAWVARIVPERASRALRELAGAPQQLEEVQLCQQAAERLKRMAAEVNNMGLRKQALLDLRLAIEVAEGFIARHKASGYCREARHPVRF
jgi:hypothetical protein